MDTNTQLTLHITATPSLTLLPRCLQILSRRGFLLTDVTTENVSDVAVILHLAVVGPLRWHQPIVSLLGRVVEVSAVTATQKVAVASHA